MLDDTGGSLELRWPCTRRHRPSGYASKTAEAPRKASSCSYQLAVDGAPELEPDAFAWSNGRQSAPSRSAVRIEREDFEPNGGSDLSTVEVMLASNQGATP